MCFLHLSKTAKADIASAVKHISKVLKAPMAARNLYDAVEKHEAIIAEMPHIFPFVSDEELAAKGLKSVKVKNYILFYTVNEKEKTVRIMRFLYGRRNWKNILKEQLFC
jgi:addiction module RelE/StbE family toxin